MDELRSASDSALVVAIARYRQEALAEAYRRHAGTVFSLSLRVTGDRVLAQDVVQDIFLHLWNEPERFDSQRGSLRAYLLAHTHGRSVDMLRAEVSRRRREERHAQQTPSFTEDVEGQVWEAALAGHVHQALSALSHDEREAIRLAYFGGHTYREVAALLDEPEGTIKSRIRSGLRRLRDALSEAGIGAWAES